MQKRKEKKQSTEISLRKPNTGLTSQILLTILNIFKEIREIVSKELKLSMRKMAHQIGNKNKEKKEPNGN